MEVIYPQCDCQVKLKVEGVFGIPEEWKTTDQANVGMFGYVSKFAKFDIDKGKVFGRELTARELREQEEKSKKGGKKDSKGDTGQEERLRKQEQEQQRIKAEQLSKLSEEDRHYHILEDSFKSSQLRFENNQHQMKFTGKDYVIWEARVTRDHGEWIYLFKYPTAGEEQLAKMRKAKPKTLANINDLNPVVMRAWVDLTALNSSKQKQVTVRCKLQQIDKAGDSPEPNLDKTYIKVTIALDQPFVQTGDGIVGSNLIPNPPVAEALAPRVIVVNELKQEVKLAIESLAMQYSSMFFKELNLYEQYRAINCFVNKRGESVKRKQHFLYDFNVSGKYKILKDRIKKIIVHLCQNYFTDSLMGAKSFTGISCTIKDQFYSEIYNFLVNKYKETLRQLTVQKMESLQEVQVLSKEAQLLNMDKYLQSYKKETKREKLERTLEEYEQLYELSECDRLYQQAIESEGNAEIRYQYGMFSLKNRLKSAEQVIKLVEQYLSEDKNNEKVKFEYLLLLIGSEQEANCKKAWVLLREMLNNQQKADYLRLAGLIFENYLGKSDLGQYFYLKSERVSSNHKQSPLPEELPTLKSPLVYHTNADLQKKCSLELVKLLASYSVFAPINKLEGKMEGKNKTSELLELANLLHSQNYDEAERRGQEMLEKEKSQEVVDLLIQTGFASSNWKLAEKYLKQELLTAKEEHRKLVILLRLAYCYLKQHHFGNSKACISKYLQKKPSNSGLSWRILGISELECGNLKNSVEALRHANLLDTSNAENWLYLGIAYGRNNSLVMCNQCLNSYESLARKINDVEYRKLSQSLGDGKLRQELLVRLQRR